MANTNTHARSAVLLSAGLDSAVLAASEARTSRVQPIYVSTGLAWEAEERAALDRLLASPAFTGMDTPVTLTFTVRDLYAPTHWALRGEPPAFDTPDEDVYLTGRNVILLSKAGIYCAQQRIGRLALGPLAGNPFPDATPEFFAAMARALSLGLAHDLVVDTPFARMHKDAVIRLGVELGVPLELTLSCMNPKEGAHCGQCSKCRERRDAFHEAGVPDRTRYATVPAR
ncbi:MAG TPA: 7-cyano-7-deazaguanine synthase [Vicinamibacterales bacterium]|nr:7-cyano-7-deazaguanine synthase [Vicinamibacterales bacterium]